MLDIPEEVKNIFKQSSVSKNLRIRFPNGEREDITNDNIISESFSFTESICSQDTLKFGLCEANMVEFETFGIGNIEDCTIEVSLEIPYNGEVYPISIGTFVVDSCKKQANLDRRNIVGYSKSFNFNKISSLELGKRQDIAYSRATRGYYDYDLFKFIASNYFVGNEKILNKTLLETNDYIISSWAHHVSGFKYWTWEIYSKHYQIDTEEKLHSLYWFENNYNKNGIVKNILNDFVKKIVSWGETSPNAYVNEVSKVLHPMLSYLMPPEGISLNDGNNYIYPYPYGYDRVGNNLFNISIPYAFKVILKNDNTTIEEEYRWELVEDEPKLYLVDTSAWNNYTNIEKGDFVNKLPDTRKLTEGYIELSGLFGKIGREGAVDLISIKPKLGLYPSEMLYPAGNLYPRGMENLLTKAMYKHPVWYDDTYTLPYSKVICTYKNSETEEDTLAEYDIVEVDEGEESNYQTYDLSDNYLIKNNTFTEAEITAILETFASNVEGIKYMPAEINLVGGLPYLEAGDVIQVLTTDGGFETIILNRTLSGIQSLSDNYESRG